MDTYPLARPRAKYCPSLVHAQQLTLPPDLCFYTAFCSTDQKAMSVSEQLMWDRIKMHWLYSVIVSE